jgi:hypothetical protein
MNEKAGIPGLFTFPCRGFQELGYFSAYDKTVNK